MAILAQTCPPLIPNMHRTNTGTTTMAMAWDAPGGVSNPTYEVVLQTKPDYCGGPETLSPEVVVGTTTATSFSYTITQPDVVAVVHVRLASDHCILSSPSVGDSFTSVPSKPSPPTVTPTGALSVTYNDLRSQFVQFQRAPAGTFNFVPVGFANNCTANPKTAIDTTVTPGVYRYRTFVSDSAGFTVSDPVTATIGPPVPVTITSFTATPSTIANGQPTSVATLTWTTQGADTVTLQPVAGGTITVNVNGSLGVKPTTTTTYTLTAIQGTQSTTATVVVNVLAQPFINITKFADPVVQLANAGGGTTTYGLTNSGGTTTTVTLSQDGTIITQSPSTFSLDSGATQLITVTATAQPAGAYTVPITINYTTGVNAPLSLIHFGVQVFSTQVPVGPVTADASQVRVDVQGDASSNPTGTVTFTNNGTAALNGVLSADVEWIVPQTGAVTIQPKQSGTFTFTIDRSKRPDSGALVGSVAGHLKLTFLKPAGGSSFAKTVLDTTSPIPSVSIVKVVDTVQGAVTTAGVPPLATGEVALFVPGVGHTTSKNGTVFVSDVSLLNPQGGKSIDDVKMYYTSVSGLPSASKTTSLPPVPGQVSVAVADVVKTIFSGSSDSGTLQIRSKDASKLAVAANVTATNAANGTIGNLIPVLRSDRSAAANAKLVLAGVQKSTSAHTDLSVQETSGVNTTIQIDFLAADGSTVSSRPSDTVNAFALKQLADVVPANAVTAIITNTGSGKIAAYATAFDETSGDSWTVNDWSTQLGYDSSETVVIPVAGSVHGANNTFYKSDVMIANRGSSSATGTLTFIGRDGTSIDRPISLGARQTQVMSNIVATTFGITGDTTGYLRFTPAGSGTFAITSRASTANVSSEVPALRAAAALHVGDTRAIAGLADAERTTVLNGKPGTFRTNFAVMETSGAAVTVRVTFRFTFPAGDKVQGVGAASRDFTLNANQFLLLNSIAGAILGPPRLQYGDLQNIEADFQIIDGDGAVILFTSSVDNASGDTILRTE